MILHAIFDLDGTLADLTHRLHFIKCDSPDWDSFFKACRDDEPIWPTINTLHLLYKAGLNISIVSGRSDIVETETRTWIKSVAIHAYNLHMRKNGDHRPDYKIKSELLKNNPQWTTGNTIIFDDRTQVVNMWRKEGFTCYQVATGNF